MKVCRRRTRLKEKGYDTPLSHLKKAGRKLVGEIRRATWGHF